MRTALAAIIAALPLTLVAASGTINHPTGTDGVFMVDKLGAHARWFDPLTLQERANLPLPTNPHDFVFSPYKSPHGIQIAPDGSLYVTAELDRKILRVDPVRGRVTDAIDVEGTAHWIAILPDGSKMYVANKDDRPFVSVVDLKTKAIVARVPMPKGTQGVAASPDGKMVVAMDNAQPVAVVIDPKTDQIMDRVTLQGQSGGAYKAYFSPDGKHLLTMVGSMITILDTSNLKGLQRVLKVGASPMGIGFSADGITALVANHGDGTVSVLDLATARVTRTFKAGTGIETLGYY